MAYFFVRMLNSVPHITEKTYIESSSFL